MGEQAELIINGDVCEICGENFEDEGHGCPRRCSSCVGDDEDCSDFEWAKDMAREKRQQLEPKRIDFAIKELNKIQGIRYLVGIQTIIISLDLKRKIDFWSYTGWFCGRKPIGKIKGRGIDNLIKEIKKCQSK